MFLFECSKRNVRLVELATTAGKELRSYYDESRFKAGLRNPDRFYTGYKDISLVNRV